MRSRRGKWQTSKIEKGRTKEKEEQQHMKKKKWRKRIEHNTNGHKKNMKGFKRKNKANQGYIILVKTNILVAVMLSSHSVFMYKSFIIRIITFSYRHLFIYTNIFIWV